MERKLPHRLRFLRPYIHTYICRTKAPGWWQRWRWWRRRSDLRLPTMAYRKNSTIHRLIRSVFVAAVFTALYLLPSWPTMPRLQSIWLVHCALWAKRFHFAAFPLIASSCSEIAFGYYAAHLPTRIHTYKHTQTLAFAVNWVGKLYSGLWDICCRNRIESLPKSTNLKRFRLIKKYTVRSEREARELAVGQFGQLRCGLWREEVKKRKS